MWSVDEWSRVQACIDDLQRQHERKERRSKSSSSFSGFDPEDRPVLISEYYSNVSCKQNCTILDTQDVIVTSSPSVAKSSVVLTITTPVSSY